MSNILSKWEDMSMDYEKDFCKNCQIMELQVLSKCTHCSHAPFIPTFPIGDYYIPKEI